MKALERENRELRQANEILRKAFCVFCPGGARPPVQAMIAFIDDHRAAYGVEAGLPCAEDRPVHLSRARTRGGVAPTRRLSHQLTPDLANAIDLEFSANRRRISMPSTGIPLDAPRRRVGATPPRVVRVIGGRGDLQHTADRLDPICGAMIVYEGDHGLKPAVELRLGKIRRGLAQDLVWPGEVPVLALQRLHPLALVGRKTCPSARSRSAWATQLCKVCAVHPILAAIETIRRPLRACSPLCSITIRTARSRTFRRKLPSALLLVHGPHPLKSLEPPANPGAVQNRSPP